MTPAQSSVAAAIGEVDRLKKILIKGLSNQVRSDDETQVASATANAWFNSHRAAIAAAVGEAQVSGLDSQYRALMAASRKATIRSKYIDLLKGLRKILTQLESEHVLSLSANPGGAVNATTDAAPDFSRLITDWKMKAILENRWKECVKCVQAEATLSAVVMMGGMLEGLLLARVNQLVDKSPVFKAASAPKDKIGNPLKLNEWSFNDYLNVAHELTWISKMTKDVGVVVRDYRNYIHPQKEYSHGISISVDDARTMWEIAKTIARQVIKP